MKPTQKQIWNAEVRFAVSPQWNTLGSAIERAIESALTFASIAREKRMREALIKLRDCDWTITLPDRMDAVREIARDGLEEP